MADKATLSQQFAMGGAAIGLKIGGVLDKINEELAVPGQVRGKAISKSVTSTVLKAKNSITGFFKGLEDGANEAKKELS